ncbi:MAG: hypothetical protein RQ752_02720 [Thermohalobaculum sp.]|nr:hypothetical protein [Thermohalobaculum sp.]
MNMRKKARLPLGRARPVKKIPSGQAPEGAAQLAAVCRTIWAEHTR